MVHLELPRLSSRMVPLPTRPLRFAIALLLSLAFSVYAEASSAVQEWLRGAWAKTETSPTLAQTTNGKETAGTEVAEPEISVRASVKGYYDNWDSDADEEGNQFTEIFTLGFDVNKLFLPSDYLSVFVEGGTIQTEVTRGKRSTSLATSTDTTVGVTYSTFDYKTWGLEGSLNFNIPTGKTRLSELELTASPNPSVVSRSVLGAGFNVGFGLKYLQQVDQLHFYTGIGYTHRGSYDPTRERSGDTVSAGDEYNFSIGGNYQFNAVFNLGADVTYTRSEGIGDQNANSVFYRIPARLTLESWTITGSYSLGFSDSEPVKATTLIREEEFQEGVSHTWNVEVAYKVVDPLTLKALAEGSVNDTERPADPTFFTTNSRFAFGVGASWNIPGTPLTLDGLGKYFEVFSEDSFGTSVTFTGYSFLLEVAGRF